MSKQLYKIGSIHYRYGKIVSRQNYDGVPMVIFKDEYNVYHAITIDNLSRDELYLC